MRSMFPGYYRPKRDEFADKFKSCVFCFDTNVLLNIYRYTPESRDNLIKVLQHAMIKDRIWLPHRVGFEYQRRRTDVILGQLSLVSKAEDIIETAIANLEKLRRSTMFAVNALIDPIKSDLEAVQAKLNLKKEEKPDLLEGDAIFDALTELFEGKVGMPYDPEQEKAIYKKGKDRYDAKIPPGYEDHSNNPSDTDQYGDLVIWLQIVDYAKTQDSPIILVTDDAKEDWWRVVRGETLGPRVELIEEFSKETGGKWIYMYSTEQFLKHAKEHLEAPVTPQVIQEAKDIKKHDAQEEKARTTVVNIGEALEALENGDERALAAAATAIEQTGGPHIPPPYTNFLEAFRNSTAASDGLRRAIAELQLPGEELRRAMAGQTQINDEIKRAMAGVKFSGVELSRALDLRLQNEELRRAMARLTLPSDEIRRAIAGLTLPSDEVRRALAGLREVNDVLMKAKVPPQIERVEQPPTPESPIQEEGNRGT